jgi:histidine triad (HIT) family protein
MVDSIFTKIIKGEIPCYRIAEDERYLAILDVFPLVKGHTLVIPKKQVDYIFDLETEDYIGLQLFAKKIAVAVEKFIPCTRISVAVIGLEVPHTHIHLIPINEMRDCNFSNPKQKFPPEEMERIAEGIRANVAL